MKRILAVIAVISLFVCAVAQLAEKQVVTLSHEGDLSFFTSATALEEALNQAQHGDTIYLSEGVFTSSSSTLTIDKRVSIIGCGYKSYILTPLSVSLPGSDSELIELTLFEGVRINKINISRPNITPTNLRTTFTKTWIETLHYLFGIGSKIIIDRCRIDESSFPYAANIEVYIQNSKIGDVKSRTTNGDFSDVQIANCNIGNTVFFPRIAYSSIFDKFTVSSSSSVLYNCLIRRSLESRYGQLVDCYYLDLEEGLLDDDLEATVDLVEAGYLGQDGTQVGIYGGDFPYSVYPNLPTVDSENSSVEYDAENNKLNVTITVAPN